MGGAGWCEYFSGRGTIAWRGLFAVILDGTVHTLAWACSNIPGNRDE